MRKIYVVGGANIDIIAKSEKYLIPNDSNPGHVHYSVGGVAHNVAVNLAKIGCNVSYITALSKDSFGDRIRKDCLDSGLDISNCQEIDDCGSSLYIAICEPDGEMAVAIADMEILSHLDVGKVTAILEKLDEDDIVVLDTNLYPAQLEKLTAACKGRIYVDPISTTKAQKIVPFLNRLEMVKPNLLEAEQMVGVECGTSDDYLKILEAFTKTGVNSVVISMAADGIIAARGDEKYHLSTLNIEIVNTTGAGDAFMAGYIYGQYHGLSFVESLRYAISNSCIALMSADSVNHDNSEELLKKMYERVCRESVLTCLEKH